MARRPADSRYECVPRDAAALRADNALATRFLVPSLLRLYVDIEFTGAANQFYDKFNIRHQIGEMCEYLWRLDDHRAAWSALATHDAAFYVRFLNMLINDAIWLLDESMKKLPELREHAAETADAQAWASRPARERQEREAANRQNERALRSGPDPGQGARGHDGVHVRATSRRRFEAGDGRQRRAMLNYFLLYLMGPERKQLKFADREKMKALAWDPPEMLGMIVDVYLHLLAADAGRLRRRRRRRRSRVPRRGVRGDGRDFEAARDQVRGGHRRVRGARGARPFDARRRRGGRGGPRRRPGRIPRSHHVHAHDGPGASAERRHDGPRQHHAAPARTSQPVHRAAAQPGDLVPNEALKAEIETVSEQRGAHASRGG